MSVFGGYIPLGGIGTGGGSATSGNVSGSFTDALQLVDSTFVTMETISGGKAAAFNQSGYLQVAMASVSGRMPAVGIIRDNVLSGQNVTLYRGGQLFNQPLSGTPWNFSGWTDQPLYVGMSGDVIASGAPTLSGNIQQIVGVSVCQSGLMIQLGDALEGVVAGSGDIGSGAITGQAGGGSFCVASGTLGTNDHGSGSIVSGLIASGQLGSFHGSSGMVTWGGANLTPFNSGNNWGFACPITEETISGIRAVCVSQSGNLRVAMASISGRMPAIGVVLDNVLSGIKVNVFTQGVFQLGSGMADYSGYLNKALVVGRSGQIVTASGSFNSGGLNLASGGDFFQRVGVAISSGALIVNIDPTVSQNILIGTLDLADVANRGFGV